MITIPQKLYVGRQMREKEIPLAFVTPETNDKAFLKRKETVDNWVNGYGWRKGDKEPELEALHLNNVPLEGYAIAEEIRRCGWGHGNVLWRIVDPRGFEFEISSQNLAAILDSGTITNGVIQGACVFGRDGAHNVLLPITSEPYRAACGNTERASKKISLRQVKPGDRIVLKDGTSAIFVGARKILFFNGERVRGESLYGYRYELKDRYLYIAGAKDEDFDGEEENAPVVPRLHAVSNLHVSEILEHGVAIDPSILSQAPSGIYGSYGIVACLDAKTKIEDLHFNLVETSLADFRKVAIDRQSRGIYSGVYHLWKAPERGFQVTRSRSNQHDSVQIQSARMYWFSGDGIRNTQHLTDLSNLDLNSNVLWLDSGVRYVHSFCRVTPLHDFYLSDDQINSGTLYALSIQHKDGTVYSLR